MDATCTNDPLMIIMVSQALRPPVRTDAESSSGVFFCETSIIPLHQRILWIMEIAKEFVASSKVMAFGTKQIRYP